MTDAIFDFLVKRMADPDTNWSVGSFGAIAEFTRDPEEPVAVVRDDTSLIAVTARGGIRIKPLAQMRLYASETAVGRNWNHRISLCLPQRSSAMGRRAVLTELGPDDQALRDEDKGGVLFDLGLNCLQIDALIRTRDPDLITLLRNHTGQSLLEPGNGAMAAILPAKCSSRFRPRMEKARTDRIPTSCRSCWRTSARMQRPSRCPLAPSPAPIAIRRIP
jgi:hypothetical protein